MKAKLVDEGRKLWIDCPACGIPHVSRLATAFPESPHWSWNGSLEAPTLSPSLLVTGEMGGEPLLCHSFVRDGQIEFLGDCLHEMAGKTVPLPEVDQ